MKLDFFKQGHNPERRVFFSYIFVILYTQLNYNNLIVLVILNFIILNLMRKDVSHNIQYNISKNLSSCINKPKITCDTVTMMSLLEWFRVK